mgnify:CR=1 FL=1
MLLYIYSDVLICQGKTKAAVEVYYNLLNWDLLVNSISYSNCMEEMYLGVVYNLYQLLLMEGRSLEAKQVYDEHYAVIQYALEDYKTQLNFAKVENDLKMIEQWESAYDILEHGKIGFIYMPEGLNGYMYNAVHESISYRSMIRERLENINSNEAVYLDIGQIGANNYFEILTPPEGESVTYTLGFFLSEEEYQAGKNGELYLWYSMDEAQSVEELQLLFLSPESLQ